MENVDEEDFLQELEADREMRTRVNIYKSGHVVKKDDDDNNDDDGEDEDDQKITLDELLDNLVLDSKPDDANEVDDGDDEMEGNQGVFITDGERAARDNIGYVGRDEANNIASKEIATPVTGWGKDFMEDR
jgi:nonsense-mediated mRNA decay protein 3